MNFSTFSRSAKSLYFSFSLVGLSSFLSPALAFNIRLSSTSDPGTDFVSSSVYHETIFPFVYESWEVFRDPLAIQELPVGGTPKFLSKVRADYPNWTFNSSPNGLSGDLIVNQHSVCSPIILCSVRGGSIGSILDLSYAPAFNDLIVDDNQAHWIQIVENNHSVPAADEFQRDSHGIPEFITDVSPNATTPYYDDGSTASAISFLDTPRRPDEFEEHDWLAELYYVQETAPETVTVYDGISWGWKNRKRGEVTFGSKGTDLRFIDPAPETAVTKGAGTDRFEWGIGVDGSGPSSIEFKEKPFEAKLGELFAIGDITFSNGTTRGSTQASLVSVRLETDIEIPAFIDSDYTARFTDLISISNTTNIEGRPFRSADSIQLFSISGLSTETGVFLNVLEGKSATAELLARISPTRLAERDNSGDLINALTDDFSTETSTSIDESNPEYMLELLGFGDVIAGQGFVTTTNGTVISSSIPNTPSVIIRENPVSVPEPSGVTAFFGLTGIATVLRRKAA